MISMEELLPDELEFKELPDNIQHNLEVLEDRLNKVRKLYNRPMIVSSGLRTKEQHLALYKRLGISKVPMKSSHLDGSAADIADPKKLLQQWCLDNESSLTEIGLWMEDFSATPTWVHFQIRPPRSGKRWFKP